MSEKRESAEVPRGRVQVMPQQMTESPRSWLKGLHYVETLDEAEKRKEPFGVRGIQLAACIQAAGHVFMQKTTIFENSGDVSHYQFAPKGASK